jgi:hypothetical protein
VMRLNMDRDPRRIETRSVYRSFGHGPQNIIFFRDWSLRSLVAAFCGARLL